MSRDISEQVCKKAKDISVFSFSDNVQLLIFLRDVNEKVAVTQELSSMQTIQGYIKGTDLFECVTRLIDKCGLALEKMAGITTDRAPAMVSCRNGLATLVEECRGKVMKYHCFLHQQIESTESPAVKVDVRGSGCGIWSFIIKKFGG
ncbi:UNVERIFIED_CONTAM: hypothetical protein FKN15_054207 [Acipenser sinensis]